MVGRAFYGANHFRTQYLYNGAIYDYDGMDDGIAKELTDVTAKTALYGQNINPPPGFSTTTVVYKLRGGISSQESFLEGQVAKVLELHQISVSGTQGLQKPPVLKYCGADLSPEVNCPWFAKSKQVYTWEYTRAIPKSSTIPPEESTTLHHRVIPITDDESNERSILPPQESPTQHPDEKGSPQLQDEEDDDSVESDSLFNCRCGVAGNGPELDTEAPGAIQCHGCKDWMHLACQRGGRGSWLPEEIDFFCDYCSKGKSYMVPTPLKGWPQRNQINYLLAGRGALILVGQYWYPGRILRKVELGHETQWDVKLWRDCSILESNQGKFLIYNSIKKSEIVDELWKDIQSQ
ncbi:hypothetical protein BDQ17DRAFT_1329007 [Cyathus striatus]|nr:hypothetical protein BDQ17DRAFT_1329007 [Cyathus striatus]